MAERRRVSPSSGNRPLALLRSRMRSLQREAEVALERTDAEGPGSRSRSFQKRLLQASPLREGLGNGSRHGLADREGRAERLLSGLERELMRRLKSVLERLDLPNRQELKALDERIRGLEKRVNEQLPPRRTARRKTSHGRPSRR